MVSKNSIAVLLIVALVGNIIWAAPVHAGTIKKSKECVVGSMVPNKKITVTWGTKGTKKNIQKRPLIVQITSNVANTGSYDRAVLRYYYGSGTTVKAYNFAPTAKSKVLYNLTGLNRYSDKGTAPRLTVTVMRSMGKAYDVLCRATVGS